MKNIHRWGFRLHSYRNCHLDVWRFSPTRQYLICHRSGRLGDRVGYEKLTAFLELESAIRAGGELPRKATACEFKYLVARSG
jgi:hypothetical protein